MKIISKDDKSKMLYESRQAEISDELTRLKSAKEEGVTETATKIARNLINMGLTVEQVAKGAELPIEKVVEIKKSMLQ